MEVQSDEIETGVPDEYADEDLPAQPPVSRLDVLIGPQRHMLGRLQETQHERPPPAHGRTDYWRVAAAASSCSANTATANASAAKQPAGTFERRLPSVQGWRLICKQNALDLKCTLTSSMHPCRNSGEPCPARGWFFKRCVMTRVSFGQLPMLVRVVTGVALFNAWVSLEEFVVDRIGLWKYMPYYKVGQGCVWDLTVAVLI